MKIINIVISVMCVAFSAMALENINDYVLKAYKLTSTEESQFASNNLVSSFWQTWENANLDTLNVVYDYVHLTPGKNGWVDGGNSFSGDSDADAIIRAAYGENGLYLYFGITDNVWQPPAGYNADGVDFLMDKMSAKEIRECNPYDCYISPSWGRTLTYSTIQYQVNVGAANGSLVDYMMINYFSGSAMMYNRVLISQLDSLYAGYSFDIIQLSVHSHILELYIPWAWVGYGGGLGSMPAYNKRIAVQMGYNDSDAPTQTGVKGLRWKQPGPWSSCDDNDSIPISPCDNWCDIQFGTSLDDPTGISSQHRPANVKPIEQRTTGQVYDLRGRKITGTALKNRGLAARVIQGRPAY